MVKGHVMAMIASMLVLCLAGAFLLYAFSLRQEPTGKDSIFHAIFVSANGLNKDSDVMLGGVKIGFVNSIALDPVNAVADVTFTIRGDLALPEDTEIEIGSASMTGDDVLKIFPGHSHIFLKDHAKIINTRPALSLEQQISNYIFNAGKL